MIIIALIIKITMPGKIFFIQQRVGKKRQKFSLYKFRTMRDSDRAKGGNFDAGDSSRVTSFGKILRKTKLDEIPQLFNVIIGNMSIVGPRPEVNKWTEVYYEKWDIVLSVKPGITDNASILFRNEEDILKNSDDPEETYLKIILPQKLDLYIKYVQNQSLIQDFKIVVQTIKTVLFK